MKRQRQRGQTLIELLVVLTLVGIVTAIGTSMIDRARTTVALAAATSELRALFQRVRMIAVTHDRNVAIRFRPAGEYWSWSIYEDRDGDGVRNDDIDRGIDRLLEKPRLFQFAPVRIGVPAEAIPDPATGQPLSLRLPVRFGTSQLCSFSRAGEATNGSVVLTDGRNVTVIRITGTSALVNVLRWDGKKWITGA